MNGYMENVVMGAMDVQGFQVWQLKWSPVTRLALNWQLTSLACQVSHDTQF